VYPVQSNLVDLVDAASRGDWVTVAEKAGAVNAGINILRDRIEELGGYHDDV
jgi:thiamine monophosphate kinase